VAGYSSDVVIYGRLRVGHVAVWDDCAAEFAADWVSDCIANWVL
jgi:hypothetical protein